MSRRVILSYGKKIAIICVCIALVVLVKNILTNIFSTHERASILKELQAELKHKKEQEVLLTQKLSVAKTDEFVENEARSKLGLVRDGEKIIVDERLVVAPPQAIAEEAPNWQKWIKLFSK